MLATLVLGCFAATPVVSPAVAPPRPVLKIFSPANQEPADACTVDFPGQAPSSGNAAVPIDALPILPRPKPVRVESGIDWRKLGSNSIRFLAIMHGFRWITEPGTRAGGVGLGGGYLSSAGNVHGWADGDPFYVNYIGHPMQGGVSGRLFLLSNPRYNRTEFGRSPEYWKGKLRAAAFAWAISEQFEIGPLSEASIGHIQAHFPQQGFVDHVITPTIGLAWMLGEDAVDRYVIRRVEDRTTNKWLRLVARTGLNPTRSFANLIDARAPWDRGSRSGILAYKPEHASASASRGEAASLDPKAAPFEFTMSSGWRQFGGGPCVGGGAEAAYRVSPNVQVVLAVNGCKLLGLKKDLSGDALLYQIGPRWTPERPESGVHRRTCWLAASKSLRSSCTPKRKLPLRKRTRTWTRCSPTHCTTNTPPGRSQTV